MQTVRVVMVANGSSGAVGAFDWFRAVDTVVAPSRSAYPAGIPWPVPGVVEMENFDNGGSGVAWNDTTAGNAGGQYRITEGVDIARDSGAGNGYVVGWTAPGEWMEYTVNVLTGGTYTLETRVAGVGVGGQFRIEVNGVDKTGNLSVPNTGAWNAYQTVQKTGVSLVSGVQTVRVVMVANGSGGAVAALDFFQFNLNAALPAVLRTAKQMSPHLLDVRTSDESVNPGAGWAMVDRDSATSWSGVSNAGGWWVALVYEPSLAMKSLTVDWAAGSPTNIQCLYSLDAENWSEATLPITNGPVLLNYLWLVFPADNKNQTPSILDIRVGE